MFPSFIHYIIYSVCCPQSRRLGFLDMGMGIAWRSKRLQVYWQDHILHCHNFQHDWLQNTTKKRNGLEAKDKTALVLGAGYLIDLDLPLFARHFKEIILTDANPLCLPLWRRAQVRLGSGCLLSWFIADISGLMNKWRRSLEVSLRSLPRSSKKWDLALELMRNIPHEVEEAERKSTENVYDCLGDRRVDAVISLNLLSQIPLVWQELAKKIFRKHFSKKQLSLQKQDWLDAFYPGASFLIRKHLRDLANLGPNEILLLTDVDYAYYTWPQRFARRKAEATPFVWDNGDPASWRLNPESEPMLAESEKPPRCEVFGALYDADLESNTYIRSMFPTYSVRKNTSWLWHIQPYGTERFMSHGTIHRVLGIVLRRDYVEN